MVTWQKIDAKCEDGHVYLVYDEKNGYYLAYYTAFANRENKSVGRGWIGFQDHKLLTKITHYMPLPEPPND